MLHDSQDMNYRNPFGAIESGNDIMLAIEVKEGRNVNLILYKDEICTEIPCVKSIEDRFKVKIKTDNFKGVMYYYFKVELTNGDILYYGNNMELLGGEGQVYTYNPSSFQITVYEPYSTPQWFKEGVVYQIFVDSFFNGNEDSRVLNLKRNSLVYGSFMDEPMYIKDHNGKIIRWAFYGGNLNGVIKKLQYIKSLGVTIIYLNPIFEGRSPHKYDTSNYEKIDPMFGDEETFKTLCDEARKLGINIILDGVFSHTGADSIYFNKYNSYDCIGAYNDKTSKYYQWYRFKEYPNDYECWWGVDDLPNVDELNEGYLEYIVKGEDSIIKKWMSLGASGWRLDVADELPDQFIKLLRETTKNVNSQSILIGEVWEDASNKVSYGVKREYTLGKELDSVTNYPLRNIIIEFLNGYMEGQVVKKKVMSLYENYPKEFFYSCLNLLGSHDTERIVTKLSGEGKSKEQTLRLVKLARLMQITLPGVPCIYYGDETGLRGGTDPSNRKSYQWGLEDTDLINHYKELITIRNSNNLFVNGDLTFLRGKKDFILYFREFQGDKIYIAINRSLVNYNYIELDSKTIQNIYGNWEVISNKEIRVKPMEGIIFKLK